MRQLKKARVLSDSTKSQSALAPTKQLVDEPAVETLGRRRPRRRIAPDRGRWHWGRGIATRENWSSRRTGHDRRGCRRGWQRAGRDWKRGRGRRRLIAEAREQGRKRWRAGARQGRNRDTLMRGSHEP